jgi:hypothetical protein
MALTGPAKLAIGAGIAIVAITGMMFTLNALSGGYSENVAATELAPIVDAVADPDGRVVCERGDPGTGGFLAAGNVPWAQTAIVMPDTADLDAHVIQVAADAGYDLADAPESTADQHILEGTTDGVTLTAGVLRVTEWDAGCGAIEIADGEAVVQLTVDFPPTG